MEDSPMVLCVRNFIEMAQTYRATSDRIPATYDAEFHEAVEAKRRGAYVTSVALYAAMTHRWRTLHTGLIAAMYKSVAASGHLGEAVNLIGLGQLIYEKNPFVPPPGLTGIDTTSFFQKHMWSLRDAVASPESLTAYLAPLSGAPDYRFPRDFDAAVAEFWDHPSLSRSRRT